MSYLLVTFVYFLIVSLLRWQFNLSLLLLWGGAFLGTFLLDLDHLIYAFFLYPEEETSQKIIHLWRIKKVKEVFQILTRSRQSRSHLIFHTATFQIILFVLSFYILTSGGSLFASAMVMAINLHLLKDEIFDLKEKGGKAVSEWLFWQIRAPMTKYFQIYLVSVSGAFLILSLWLIR